MFNRFTKAALSLVLLTFLALCQTAPVQSYPMDNVFVRITDANGKAVSGGKVYVFTAGTTTPVDTHSCAAMSACTNAHPVVADSGGKIAAMYIPAGSYKIRYTNSAGTTLYEVDNYVVTDIDAINDNNFPVTAKTADYTIAATDDGTVFSVDASAAPGTLVTITAKAQVRGNGFPFCVVNSATTGTVTITPDAGETVNGAASYSLTTQYQSACFVSRGAAGWFIYAERDPAGTFSTAVTFQDTATFNDDLVAPPVTLTDAATIAWDMSTGTNFVVTLGGNRTLDAPTGEVAGQFGLLRVIQDGTGSRTLTFNAAYSAWLRPDPEASATTIYRYDVRGANDVILTKLGGGFDYLATNLSATLGAATVTIDNTVITRSYRRLELIIQFLSHDNGTSRYPQIELSGNNGSTWSAAQPLTAAGDVIAAAANFGARLTIDNAAAASANRINTITSSNGASAAAQQYSFVTSVTTGPVNAMRFSWSGLGNFDAFTYTLIGAN